MKRMSGNMVRMLVSLGLVLSVASTAAAQQKPVLDRYLDKYWGKVRKIKVIQKRLFLKEGRFEVTPFAGVIPNDEFFMYYPIGARFTYFFSEDIGAELFGTYIIETQSDLADFLDKEFHVLTHLPQRLQWSAGVDGFWCLFHGKMALLTQKLFHFDMHLAVGVGAIGTIVSTREKGKKEKAKQDIAGNVGVGVRVYLADWAALRIEYRHFFYAAEGGGVSYPAEITFGLGMYLN